MMKRASLLLVAVLLLPTSLFAWGEKGHLMVNEAATLSLPTDMPTFFLKAFPDLGWYGPEPDRWKGAGQSLDAINEPDHFLDYEFAAGLDLPRDRYQYVALMGSSGRLARFAITNSETGFLPWRIAELSERLTNLFRRWRSTPATASERAYIEREIIIVAGVLGHFAGDSSNPHHATINYNGWITPNPNGYANDCQIHARFERDFVTHWISQDEVTANVPPPQLRTDYFNSALEVIRNSNSLVERIYQLDKRNAFDEFGPGDAEARAFAASRLGAGAGFLRDLWWSAWKNSASAPPRRAS